MRKIIGKSVDDWFFEQRYGKFGITSREDWINLTEEEQNELMKKVGVKKAKVF